MVDSYTLSKRQAEICQLLLDGFSCKEVASKIFISPKTVEAHKTRIFSKLDVHSLIQLSNKVRGGVSIQVMELPAGAYNRLLVQINSKLDEILSTLRGRGPYV
jgi:DNA-binding CsgD family transcriptional regulator